VAFHAIENRRRRFHKSLPAILRKVYFDNRLYVVPARDSDSTRYKPRSLHAPTDKNAGATWFASNWTQVWHSLPGRGLEPITVFDVRRRLVVLATERAVEI
jgi:hypothetical protein